MRVSAWPRFWATTISGIAVKAIREVNSALPSAGNPEFDLRRIQQELDERDEQAVALLEGAAVGLSARGIAHELRTHLTEIRQRAAALEKAAKSKGASYDIVAPHVRGIKAACGAISNAAALIDPMLPNPRPTSRRLKRPNCPNVGAT